MITKGTQGREEGKLGVLDQLTEITANKQPGTERELCLILIISFWKLFLKTYRYIFKSPYTVYKKLTVLLN